MRKYGYLVVEGPHDVEFSYRLLAPFGLQRIRLEADLDSFFTKLIPRQYPIDGDLQKRMPVPLFLQSDTHSIAVHSVGGDSRLAPAVQESAAILDIFSMTGIGVILDSDRQDSVAKRYSELIAGLDGLGLNLPHSSGIIAPGPPNFGAWILPDNNNPGTLEDLLIESAAKAYPGLLASAKTHVSACANTGITKADLADFNKPSGRAKAIIGSVSNILRPGKAVQVSIQDNAWLRGECLKIPAISSVQQFLKSLFSV